MIFKITDNFMRKLTTEEFVEKAKKVHDDKYDYSMVEYVNSRTKVCIICKIHGEFWQTPNDHLSGKGCPRCCETNVKKTKEQFIEESKKIHNGKYDYSMVGYVNSHTKVCIICPIHGEFWQTPSNHLRGKGCPKCVGRNKNNEEIIESFKKVHGGKYDYSKVNFKRMNEKVCIVCPKHGEFFQTPNLHLKGCGCQKCGNEKVGYYQRLGLDVFIKRSNVIHGDKYDYSKVEYVNNETKVCIICPKHGEFWQLPYDHLCGKGCLKCAHEKIGKAKTLQFNTFLKRATDLHMGKYSYDESTYVNTSTKMRMVCPIHGEFYQDPSHHLGGNGCPHCNESKLEASIVRLLSENKIKFSRKQHFNWLGKQHLDFYLPKYKLAIECQGEQHFRPTNFGSKTKTNEECFEETIERDYRKKLLCQENNVALLYYSDKQYVDDIIVDENKLLEQIKNGNDI